MYESDSDIQYTDDEKDDCGDGDDNQKITVPFKMQNL